MIENNQKGCLLIGEGVTIKGTFTVPDIVTVAGTVEGELFARETIIEATGFVKGKIESDTVDVKGRTEESILAKKFMIIRSTGSVSGTIKYAEIEIEKGGHLHGDVQSNL
ncbi:bactofilin family protein [Polynucleobacter asymbioticus]|jgi:cytoskeletal protein CcmA (bactofilin family)|uniref:Polymer-forming cytoskeletal protein n=1 Tax=Polynucleobacter asymbioticus TaxID=576611 RepID=A0AAC9IPM2_9BURK|nr:polymer-forming cytoskeletal protein [Polynucleobacter asymbioticus]APB98173.1 hypothetical protein A4F89_01890 [Polynucleobacter asymbioticus]APC00459.1 hypothetical protein AOC25_01895 [Polynucleobacter asymbioticus]